MWFWRGTQSAIFYYVACTPCAEWKYKRRRRREADRTKKERDALELEQPGIIQQPVPFQTNRYWAEEIMAGPGPPSGWTGHVKPSAAREANKNKCNGPKKRRSVFAPEPVSPTSSTEPELHSKELVSAQPEFSTRDAIKEGFKAAISPEKWNWIRHDRPDEILWGYEPISRILKGKGREGGTSGPSTQSPNASRRRRSNTVGSDTSDAWTEYGYATRHPEVNDLHPPVVSMLPRSRSEAAWMIQPPPPAAVMEGKVHPDDAPIQPRPLHPLTRRDDKQDHQSHYRNLQRQGSKHHPPAIIVSAEDSTSRSRSSSDTSLSTHEQSASSANYITKPQPVRQRIHESSPLRNSYTQIHRPPLATIVSYDGAHIGRPLKQPPASPEFNSRSSSPYRPKFPSSYDQYFNKPLERSGDQTPPEWDFLLAQLYSPAIDATFEAENLTATRPGLQRLAGARASWHGHERRWSEL